MAAAPPPDTEAARLQALRALDVLDSAPEAEFDALVQAAAIVCDVPISLISLIDEDRQWFKAQVGLPGVGQTPRSHAFCSHAIQAGGLFEVVDARLDPRFADNPLVTGRPGIRFYAGSPLRLAEGACVGTLCVIDRRPRHLTSHQRQVLGLLAATAARVLEGRRALSAEQALRADQARLAHALADSEGRFRSFSDSLPVGVFATDAQGRCIYTNPSWQTIHGLTAEQAQGHGWMRSLHPLDRERVLAEWQRCVADERVVDHAFRLLQPAGGLRHVHARAQAIRDSAGRITGHVGSVEDVTLQVQQRQALEAAHQRMALATDSGGIGVWDLDPASGVLTWDHWMYQFYGQVPDQVQPSHALWLQLLHPDDRAAAEQAVRDAITGTRDLNTEFRIRWPDGSVRHLRSTARVSRDPRGHALRMVGVSWDVTAQRRARGEINWRASHDPLTGLINRAEFETELRGLLARSRDAGAEHALLFIDLDQFKQVNDACGHSAGDQLLQQVARLLLDSVRARDTVARLGGDEFAVLLSDCGSAHALRVGRQICDRVQAHRFMHEGRSFRIGASIGLAQVDKRWDTLAALMQAADTACYAAKDAGRNQVVAWRDSDHTQRARHGLSQWHSRLAQALDEQRFVLLAQQVLPLTDADADADAGAGGHPAAPADALQAELLLRLVDSDGCQLAPGAFLPAAERFHLAPAIDRWVLQQTLGLLQGQGPQGLQGSRGTHATVAARAHLSINLSTQAIGDPAFQRQALDLLGQADPAVCRCLALEFSEAAVITHLPDAARFAVQLRALGVRVILDDFGAAGASFAYLRSLQVDQLKIDTRLTRRLTEDALDEAAVRCCVDVARVLGVPTVAKAVEQPAVLARLRQIGVGLAQGFLLHRPQLADQWLRQPMPAGAGSCPAPALVAESTPLAG